MIKRNLFFFLSFYLFSFWYRQKRELDKVRVKGK
jgi:hypothetical protein